MSFLSAAQLGSIVVAATLGCALPPAVAGAGIEAEAREFMQRYAADLRAVDRKALAQRYSRSGAHILVKDQNVLLPFAAIAQRYAQDWTPPHAFEWRNLSYTPLGNDAVMVLGSLEWQKSSDATPSRYVYTAVLAREDGSLRLRLEHECLVQHR